MSTHVNSATIQKPDTSNVHDIPAVYTRKSSLCGGISSCLEDKDGRFLHNPLKSTGIPGVGHALYPQSSRCNTMTKGELVRVPLRCNPRSTVGNEIPTHHHILTPLDTFGLLARRGTRRTKQQQGSLSIPQTVSLQHNPGMDGFDLRNSAGVVDNTKQKREARRSKKKGLAKLGRLMLSEPPIDSITSQKRPPTADGSEDDKMISPQGNTPTPMGISTSRPGADAHTKNSDMAIENTANPGIDLVLPSSDPSEVDTVVIYVEPPLIELVYRSVEQMGRCGERGGAQEAIKQIENNHRTKCNNAPTHTRKSPIQHSRCHLMKIPY